MNRYYTYLLTTLIALPTLLLGMKPRAGIDPEQYPSVTRDHHEKRFKGDSLTANPKKNEYTLFYFYDCVYAYQEAHDQVTNQTVIYVFSSFNQYTTPAESTKKMGSATSWWTKSEFEMLRSMDKNLATIQSALQPSAVHQNLAQRWLGNVRTASYTQAVNNYLKDHTEALRVAFVQGRDGLVELRTFEKIINDAHSQLIRAIRMAQRKYYGTICACATLAMGGLYAAFQWYTQADEERHETDTEPENTADERR